jgi:hypothetical protein
VILQRALAILSAVLLVGSVALATLGFRLATLGRALSAAGIDVPDAIQGWLSRNVGAWAWNLIQAVLERPAWLLPTSLGIICAGLALSLMNRKSTHRSHRRS